LTKDSKKVQESKIEADGSIAPMIPVLPETDKATSTIELSNVKAATKEASTLSDSNSLKKRFLDDESPAKPA
jgi:hypothetical protein